MRTALLKKFRRRLVSVDYSDPNILADITIIGENGRLRDISITGCFADVRWVCIYMFGLGWVNDVLDKHVESVRKKYVPARIKRMESSKLKTRYTF